MTGKMTTSFTIVPRQHAEFVLQNAPNIGSLVGSDKAVTPRRGPPGGDTPLILEGHGMDWDQPSTCDEEIADVSRQRAEFVLHNAPKIGSLVAFDKAATSRQRHSDRDTLFFSEGASALCSGPVGWDQSIMCDEEMADMDIEMFRTPPRQTLVSTRPRRPRRPKQPSRVAVIHPRRHCVGESLRHCVGESLSSSSDLTRHCVGESLSASSSSDLTPRSISKDLIIALQSASPVSEHGRGYPAAKSQQSSTSCRQTIHDLPVHLGVVPDLVL